MSGESTGDMTLITRQQRQLLSEMGVMRDDMPVATAILQRLDGTVPGLVNEIRTMLSRQSPFTDRVRDFEGHQSPRP